MILVNKIKTPDGTILESRYRHDFRSHVDKTNGFEYFVDGGHDYLRRSFGMPYENLSVSTEEPIERIRELFEWGTYGKDGKGPLRKILLKDMETAHIKAILKDHNKYDCYPVINLVFERELEYRSNKIKEMKKKMKPKCDICDDKGYHNGYGYMWIEWGPCRCDLGQKMEEERRLKEKELNLKTPFWKKYLDDILIILSTFLLITIGIIKLLHRGIK